MTRNPAQGRHRASLVILFAMLLAMVAPVTAFASDHNDDMHCDDHSSAHKVEGASGSTTVEDVTISWSDKTVTASGGDATICVKGGPDNSGTVALTDGQSYTVDFINPGGNNPAISYLVVYSTTPVENGENGENDEETGNGTPAAEIDLSVSMDTDGICVGDEIAITIDNDTAAAVTVTGTLHLPGGGEMPLLYELGANAAHTVTDTVTAEGTYEVTWTATAGELAAVSGSFSFEVADCTTEGDETDNGNGNGPDGWVTICHATSAPNNPYNAITVSVNGLNGHGDHTGPIFDPENPHIEWGDIIPPFDDEGQPLPDGFEGLNWPEGQQILDNDCEFVLPSDDEPTVTPDIEVGDEEDVLEIHREALFAEVCIGADVTLLLTVDGAESTLGLTFAGDDLDLLDGLDLTDLGLDDGTWSHTLENLQEGTYELPFTVTDGDDVLVEGAWTIVVVECDEVEDGAVEIVPDIEVGDEDDIVHIDRDALSTVVCIGADVTLLISVDGEGDFSVILDDDNGDTGLSDLFDIDGFDGTWDLADFDDGVWSHTLENLEEGVYELPFTVTDGDDVEASYTFTIVVVDCEDETPTPPTPPVTPPGDGDDDTDGDEITEIVTVDARIICPDVNTLQLEVTVDGENLTTDATEGAVTLWFNGAQEVTTDVTLGETTVIDWPLDGELPAAVLGVWGAVGEIDSEMVAVTLTDIPAECEIVLDEPGVDAPDAPEGPETGLPGAPAPEAPDTEVDADTDADEAAREDDDQVLGVVHDQDTTVEAEAEAGVTVAQTTGETVAAQQLPRTGLSMAGLLAAGLFALLSGAGLLRRND